MTMMITTKTVSSEKRIYVGDFFSGMRRRTVQRKASSISVEIAYVVGTETLLKFSCVETITGRRRTLTR